MTDGMQWLDPRDERFDWLNVADWEAKGDGLQPVRVAKTWRDQWPKKTARRAMSSAGMSVRLRTDSKKLVFRVAFIDVPDTPPATPASGWERSRPNFFSLYRDGKYVTSMAALTHFEQQDVTIFNDREIAGAAELQVLLPFYYRNSEIILHAIILQFPVGDIEPIETSIAWIEPLHLVSHFLLLPSAFLLAFTLPAPA